MFFSHPFQSNILIGDCEEAILSDYGLSRILERSGFTTTTQSATWRYMAPELLSVRDDAEHSPRVTMATDVWSFAMTVIEVSYYITPSLSNVLKLGLQILTGSVPFSHIARDANVILYVTRGGLPKRECCPQVNDIVWAMLERCWDVAPHRRPSMATLSRFFFSMQVISRA